MRPDPGQNFASDEHRRVMGSLPAPDQDHTSVVDLAAKVTTDDFLDLDEDELDEILADLEADGDAEQEDDAWRSTTAGYDALTGLPAEEGGRKHA